MLAFWARTRMPAQIYAAVHNLRSTLHRALLQQVSASTRKMGAQIPLDLPFVDEVGQGRHASPVFRETGDSRAGLLSVPVALQHGSERRASERKNLDLTAGSEYEVVAVSFDPRETPEMAAAKKQTYLKDYQRPGAEQGWHFLTGPETSSKALADAVGFRYVYDAMTNQYAHSSAIMILTPEGQIARYFYGIDYPARDVRLGLVEASNERIGTPTDQVLLYCFHYDPATGKYALVVMNVLAPGRSCSRWRSLATFMIVMFRRDFRAARFADREAT